MLVALREFIVLATAVAAVAFTISRTKVSEPFRNFVKKKSTWFGNLVSCPYCLSHWFSFGAVVIYRPLLVEMWLPLDMLVTAMAMVSVAAFVVGQIQSALTR